MQWLNRIAQVSILAAGALVAATPALADRYDRHPGPDSHAGYVMDSRYHHNHYYPPRGFYVNRVPSNAHFYYHGGSRYYFSGGVWYRPYGPRFVVVGAPLGLFVPILPDFYSTIWVGGNRYYYADDTYYTYDAARRGYIVVDRPADGDVREDDPSAGPGPGPGPAAPASADELFIYPKNGQSEKQQSSDRYECHRWAADQTHFDPTEQAGGVANSQAGQKSADYKRAMTACLEARGYSVK